MELRLRRSPAAGPTAGCASQLGSSQLRINDLASLVPRFEEAERQPVVRFGFDNYVQHRLAFAFVLARTGDLTRARAELDRWCELHVQGQFGPADGLGSDLQWELKDLLDRAAG